MICSACCCRCYAAFNGRRISTIRRIISTTNLSFACVIPKRLFASYYETLGVTKDADMKTIKKAYYAKCKTLHPDKANVSKNDQNEAEFLKVQKAYEVLKSKEGRTDYNSYLKSMDHIKHDFSEWKSYQAQSSGGGRDYQKYRTVRTSNGGVDAKWSDFTWRDLVVVFITICGVTYIVLWEKKLSNQNMPRSFRHRVEHIMKPNTKSKSTEKMYNPFSEKTANYPNVVKSDDKLKHTKKPKRVKKTKPKSEYSSQKMDTGTFAKIKLANYVSEESIKKLAKASDNTFNANINSLTTWK